MSIYTPYTYLIGWSEHQKYYYGVRYAKHCTPDDLWKTYFTSSKYVKDFRNKHGEPDIIQIRKTFKTAKKARDWEFKVLKLMCCAKKFKWLNQNTGGLNFHPAPSFTEEHKKKLSERKKGNKQTPEQIANRVLKNTGKKRTDEQKSRMKKAQIHRSLTTIVSDETKNKQSIARRKIPQETLRAMSSKAGKISAEKYRNDPVKQKNKSNRMKLWWKERKAADISSLSNL